jgi:four helix bundle protein
MKIQHFRELEVYRMAFDAAMKIFEITKGFPNDEKYSLVDQIRRSSRSVCSNLAEAWRKRKYVAVFKNKLTDSGPALLNSLRSKDVLHLCASK